LKCDRGLKDKNLKVSLHKCKIKIKIATANNLSACKETLAEESWGLQV